MNWTIFFLAAAFWVHQNAYFGWNALPKSDAELIADGITILLFALAVYRPIVNVNVT